MCDDLPSLANLVRRRADLSQSPRTYGGEATQINARKRLALHQQHPRRTKLHPVARVPHGVRDAYYVCTLHPPSPTLVAEL